VEIITHHAANHATFHGGNTTLWEQSCCIIRKKENPNRLNCLLTQTETCSLPGEAEKNTFALPSTALLVFQAPSGRDITLTSPTLTCEKSLELIAQSKNYSGQSAFCFGDIFIYLDLIKINLNSIMYLSN